MSNIEDARIQKIKDKINALSDRAKYNEEQTKNGFILPLFVALGYDVFDTSEFIPEYVADFGTKQGEKVDYAICINGQPLVLIEAKKIGVTLGKEQISQLFRYYASVDAKIGILTNGDDYWFFTDSARPNTMDTEPYLKIRLSKTDNVADILQSYRRENIENYDFTSDIQMSKFENKMNEFVDTLSSGSIEASFVDYLASISGVSAIEKSKMASTFMRIFRAKFNIPIIDKSKEEKEHAWDRSRMSNLDLNLEYVYNEVDWAFHKPEYIKIGGTKIDTPALKWVVVEAINYAHENFKGADEKLVNNFTGMFFITNNKNTDKNVTSVHDTGLYVDTALSGGSMVKFIHKIFELFSIKDETLLVKFKA